MFFGGYDAVCMFLMMMMCDVCIHGDDEDEALRLFPKAATMCDVFLHMIMRNVCF